MAEIAQSADGSCTGATCAPTRQPEVEAEAEADASPEVLTIANEEADGTSVVGDSGRESECGDEATAQPARTVLSIASKNSSLSDGGSSSDASSTASTMVRGPNDASCCKRFVRA